VPLVSYPFFDDMESGDSNWEWCSPWGLAAPGYSGSYSWQDSPGGTTYENNVNNALTLSIDLSTATMPVLSFWQRHSLQANKDWGLIEVSTDLGNNWTKIYFVTGQDLTWKEENVDLTPYAGGVLYIRFLLQTDGDLRYDGWYIDDVSIAETTATISYPFFDDMESGEGNWLSSSWKLVMPGHGGNYCFTDSPEGNHYSPYVQTCLTLAGTIDLSTTTQPQLTFWEHYHTYSNRCYVEVSTDSGRSWTYLTRYGGNQPNWTERQVDLTAYAGLSAVRIRFRLYTYGNYDGWYIDDVRIKEPCVPGDANMDGVVNVFDLPVEKQIILGQLPPTCGADANGDGDINVFDLIKIKRIILGLE
jgi:hypothetical protein